LRVGEISSPLKSPNLLASPISQLSLSTTGKKRRGDKGQPCLRPRSAWKKGDADPLIRTAKETFVIQPITQFMKGNAKPK